MQQDFFNFLMIVLVVQSFNTVSERYLPLVGGGITCMQHVMDGMVPPYKPAPAFTTVVDRKPEFLIRVNPADVF